MVWRALTGRIGHPDPVSHRGRARNVTVQVENCPFMPHYAHRQRRVTFRHTFLLQAPPVARLIRTRIRRKWSGVPINKRLSGVGRRGSGRRGCAALAQRMVRTDTIVREGITVPQFSCALAFISRAVVRLAGYIPPRPITTIAVGRTVPATPQTYVEHRKQSHRRHPGPAAGYWYYCADARGYYPYVKECPEAAARFAAARPAEQRTTPCTRERLVAASSAARPRCLRRVPPAGPSAMALPGTARISTSSAATTWNAGNTPTCSPRRHPAQAATTVRSRARWSHRNRRARRRRVGRGLQRRRRRRRHGAAYRHHGGHGHGHRLRVRDASRYDMAYLQCMYAKGHRVRWEAASTRLLVTLRATRNPRPP